MLVFTITQRGDTCLILVEHDIDMFSSSALASSITLAAAGTQRRIIVSLETCSFIDASALTVLIQAKTELGDRLAIVVPLENRIRRIFEITNLISWLKITTTPQG